VTKPGTRVFSLPLGRRGAPPRFGVFTPEQAAAHIRAVTDGVPAVQVYVWASIAGMPDELVHRHIELASTKLRELLA